MAYLTLADRQYTAPSAAAGVTLTLSGVDWGDSAYGELVAAVDADCILTGITVASWSSSLASYEYEVDIATGGAGSESVIATFRGEQRQVISNVTTDGMYLPAGIGIDNIANGDRLSARVRGGTTATHTVNIAVTYLKKPLTGSTLTTAQPLLTLPPAQDDFSFAMGTSWAWGSWFELSPDTRPEAIVITTLIFPTPAATMDIELQLGTAVGGDVTVLTTVRASMEGTSSNPYIYPLPNALDNVPALTSFVARARYQGTTARSMLLAINYFNKPL